MSILPTITDRNRRAQRGSAVLSAIFVLIIGMLLGLAMIRVSDGVFLSGQRQVQQQGARAMAEAGIEYAYWQYAFNAQVLPYTGSRSLGNGTFSVTVADNGLSIPGTIKFTAEGTQNGKTVTLTRVMEDLKKTPFSYAVCSNADLVTGKAFTTGYSGSLGDVRTNGKLDVNKATNVINGSVYTVGSIRVPSVTGTQFTGYAPIAFPTFNPLDYKAIADRQVPAGKNWPGFTFQKPYEIVYCPGDFTFQAGTISGTGLIVVDGNIRLNVNGNLDYALPGDIMVAITDKVVDPGTDLYTVTNYLVGYYYAHNAAGNGQIKVDKKLLNARGGFAGDTFNLGSDLYAIQDPNFNASLGARLHLPGYWP